MAVKKVRLTPPRNVETEKWQNELWERLGEGPFLVQGYDVSNPPAATDWGSLTAGNAFSALIFIYDETGGPVLAFSDGTDWRRVTDRAIIA